MVHGRLVELSLLSPTQEPRTEYQIENRGTFVEAVNGEEYAVRVNNKLGDKPIGVKIFVDGHEVASKVIYAGNRVIIKEVISKVIRVGATEKDVWSPLVFAQPDIVEEGTTLDKTVASGGADKMGLIQVYVYETYQSGEALPCVKQVVSKESLAISVNEKEGSKKGAFRSTTGLGKTERVKEASQPVSNWYFGAEHLETVELRYGSRAMLLLMGLPAAHFMARNANATGEPETVDLTADDEGADTSNDRKSKRNLVVPKREAESGSSGGGRGEAAKRPKVEPGTAAEGFFDLT